MAIVCKFPAGTKIVSKIQKSFVDENGFPCEGVGKYDKDGKKCEIGEYTDGKKTYKRHVTRGYVFFGPNGDLVTGSHDKCTSCYSSELMGEDGVIKYRSKYNLENLREDANGKYYSTELFIPAYISTDGTLSAYNPSWTQSYKNEDGETRMHSEVKDGYKDANGKVVFSEIYSTSYYEIPNSVVAIDEIDGQEVDLTVMVYNTEPPAVSKVVNLSGDDLLLVPKGSMDKYKKDAKWGKFKNISEFDINAADPVMAAAQSPEIVELLKKIDARLTAIEAKLK